MVVAGGGRQIDGGNVGSHCQGLKGAGHHGALPEQVRCLISEGVGVACIRIAGADQGER